jgi:hypothetical protein
LIKVPLPDQLLAKWFTKSLIGPISHDVTMVTIVTEEKSIIRAQYLDLIYSQMGMLYNLIPNISRPSKNPTPSPLTASHAIDGVIGKFYDETQFAHVGHTNKKYNNSIVQNTPTPTPSTGKIVEVNSVESIPT